MSPVHSCLQQCDKLIIRLPNETVTNPPMQQIWTGVLLPDGSRQSMRLFCCVKLQAWVTLSWVIFKRNFQATRWLPVTFCFLPISLQISIALSNHKHQRQGST